MTPPHVRVAGGGVAGLTAALRLAERGCRVTVYEQSPSFGGALGSRQPTNGLQFDVYPHMYLSWYRNFEQLIDDTSNRPREQLFTPYDRVNQLRQGEFPRYTSLVDPYKFSNVYKNVQSGVGRPADLYVFGYANVDLVAEQLDSSVLLDTLSLNGFLRSRPYMTERAAKAFDHWVTTVWGVPSYMVSAEDYRKYVVYSFADHDPALLLLNGPVNELVIAPLLDKLRMLGVELLAGRRVIKITCDGGRVCSITTARARYDASRNQYETTGGDQTDPVEDLVLAVPAGGLCWLATAGAKGERIVDFEEGIAEVARLRTQEVPILNLCLKDRIADVPPEPVGLVGSRFGLSFTDISQTWEGLKDGPNTVLAVSSSYPYGLPGPGDDGNAYAMLCELAKFIPSIDPGRRWRESPDIDWTRTTFQSNSDSQMFVNDAGSDLWRPDSKSTGLSNLYYAGDLCNNDIGMTTVEAAVVTGAGAAKAIVERHHIGEPVTILRPREPSTELFSTMRAVWAPFARAAKRWSNVEDMVTGSRPFSRRLQALVRQLVRED